MGVEGWEDILKGKYIFIKKMYYKNIMCINEFNEKIENKSFVCIFRICFLFLYFMNSW